MHDTDDPLLLPWTHAQTEPLACSRCQRPLESDEAIPDPNPCHRASGKTISFIIHFLCAKCAHWRTRGARTLCTPA